MTTRIVEPQGRFFDYEIGSGDGIWHVTKCEDVGDGDGVLVELNQTMYVYRNREGTIISSRANSMQVRLTGDDLRALHEALLLAKPTALQDTGESKSC